MSPRVVSRQLPSHRTRCNTLRHPSIPSKNSSLWKSTRPTNVSLTNLDPRSRLCQRHYTRTSLVLLGPDSNKVLLIFPDPHFPYTPHRQTCPLPDPPSPSSPFFVRITDVGSPTPVEVPRSCRRHPHGPPVSDHPTPTQSTQFWVVKRPLGGSVHSGV